MKKLLAAGLLLALTVMPLQAADVGQSLQPLPMQDQFGKPQLLATTTRRIYFTHDMAGGKLLKAVLGEQGQAVLDAQQAVVMSDLGGMPSVIRSTMAIPALKKRSYRIGIDDTGKQFAGLPRQPDRVTVIDLDQLKITAVRFAADEQSLKIIMAQ